MSKRVHGFVSGKVQGVFYRDSCRHKADELGLHGWVRNLPDKRVEFVAEGNDQQLDELVQWCHQGPPAARVDKVDTKQISATGEFSDFQVLR